MHFNGKINKSDVYNFSFCSYFKKVHKTIQKRKHILHFAIRSRDPCYISMSMGANRLILRRSNA